MTYAQLESWVAENESVEEFLAGATAWRADPGRRDDGLRDPARRMLYRAMKNVSFDMTAQTFGKFSGVRVFSLLQDRIEFTLFYQRQQLQRLSAAVGKKRATTQAWQSSVLTRGSPLYLEASPLRSGHGSTSRST